MHAEIKSRRALPFWLSVLLTACFAPHALSEPSAGWALPGGGQGGGHFSTATQITPDNVSDLISACMISALFLYYGGAEVPIEPARVHQTRD